MSAQENRRRYLAAYQAAPKEGDKLLKDDMLKVLQGLGKDLETIGPLFARIDADGNGGLDQNEFLLFMEEVDNAWIRIQQKTFSRWGNNVLSNRMLKLNDVSVDLRDGVLLAPLIEILSKKSVGKINQNPKMKLNKIENLNTCLNFLKHDGIKLVNISSEDLENGNLRITLGLVWMLILKYQIGDSLDEGSPKWALLEWVKRQCAPYKVGQNLKNFKSGWSDGKVLSALTDSLGEPMNGTIDTNDLSTDPYEATKVAMYTAEEKFEIPRVMDAPDLVENPDEHSVMTYVSYFRDYAENQKNKANPGQTTAHGPGVEGGDSRAGTIPFTIVAKNSQGKQCQAGGDFFAVAVHGPDGAEIKANPLKDNGDGTYSGSYPVTKPGKYAVDIALRGAPIKDSTFHPRLEAGNAGKSWADGDGLHKGKTGRPNAFVIHSVDAEGKPVKNGGDPFQVHISGPNGEIPVKVVDAGDGTYPVTYSPDHEGDYKIDVTLFGEPIKDNPFNVKIKRSPNASKSWVDGPGLKRAYDNRPANFTVHAVDDVGHPVSGDDCQVRIVPDAGGNPIPAKIKDNGDGTYDVEYAPEKPGKYHIHVQLDGQDVKGTPCPLTVREGADASKTGHANFKVTIVSRNKNGDLKTEGGDDFEVQVMGPEDVGEVPSKAKDNGDGTYTAEYQLEAPKGGDDKGPREYIIHMKLNGDYVGGFPTRQFM